MWIFRCLKDENRPCSNIQRNVTIGFDFFVPKGDGEQNAEKSKFHRPGCKSTVSLPIINYKNNN